MFGDLDAVESFGGGGGGIDDRSLEAVVGDAGVDEWGPGSESEVGGRGDGVGATWGERTKSDGVR